MAAEIFSKTGGLVSKADLGAIQLDNPSIVRLQMLRSDVASMERVGNNLVVKLTNGETVTIPNFYKEGVVGSEHNLVLQEPSGEMWLARPDLGPNYFELANWEELNDSSAAAAAAGGMGMGGILAGVAALGGLGIAAAAGGGGGGGDNGGPGGPGGPGNPGGPGGPGGTPDTTPPSAPTDLNFNTAGTVLTGKGEAGATVTVTGPNGPIPASSPVVVGQDGNFTFPITPPLTNGETVTVVQTDAAGNPSPPATKDAFDTTGPAAPTELAFNEDGTELTGEGEIGAIVTVTGPQGPIPATPPVVVGPDGTFTFPIVPPLTNGETVSVVLTDAAGNPSLPGTQDADDTTAPAAPDDVVITPDGQTVTGTGEIGATVKIYDADGEQIDIGIVTVVDVDGVGVFTATLPEALTNGEVITVTLSDAASPPNESLPAVAVAPDFPDLDLLDPQVDTGSASIITTYDSEPLTGVPAASGLVGINVAGLNPIQILAILLGNPNPGLTFEVGDDEQGAYTFTFTNIAAVDFLAAKSGILLQKNVDGNWITITPGGNPLLLSVTAANTATLKVSLDTGEYRALPTSGVLGLNIGGTLSVAGTTYDLTEPELVSSNAVGNVLANDNLTTEQAEDAIVQSVTINNVTTVITAGAGTVINGTYGVLTIDQSGTYTYVPNSSATFGVFTDIFTYTVVLDGAIAESSTLTITVTHADNLPNDFPPPSGVYDNDAPLVPTDLAVVNGATQVTGKGEPNSYVRVYSQGTNDVIGEGPVGTDGTFTIPILPAQTAEQTIEVTLTDAAGNESPRGPVTAPDVTPPDPAVLVEITDFGTILTGRGEIGATVIVYAPGGPPLQKIGEVIISATGGNPADGLNDFSVTLSPAQGTGGNLTVTLTDPAGNTSADATIPVPILSDFLPAAEGLEFNADGSVLSGEGTDGASVEVYLVGNASPIGTASVIDGEFSVTLDPPINDGQTVQVVLVLDRGSELEPLESSPVSAVGPDLLIAYDNNEVAQLLLEPVPADEDFGGDTTSYLLSVDVLGVEVTLGARYVEFDVASGTKLDALFTFGQAVSVSVLDDYQLVIEKRVGNDWVQVNSDAGDDWLLKIGLLNTEIEAEGSLGAGEYRASMRYSGSGLAVGLAASLKVEGELYDITAEPNATSVESIGNVIDDSDVSNGDIADIAPAGTKVVSVTSLDAASPTATEIPPEDTVGVTVVGKYGSLHIKADGSYTYTPTGDAKNAGKVDNFEYFIRADGYGPDEKAKLSFTIGSPDLGGPSVLADDIKSANVKFVNVVSAPVTANNVAGFNLPLIGGRQDDFTFTVGENQASSIAIKVATGSVLTVLPTLSVTIYNEDNQIVVPKISVLAIANVVELLGSGYIFNIPNSFGEGTYKVVVTGYTTLSVGATVTVSTEITTTDLTAFKIGEGGEASGNVLDNDTIDTEFFRLLVDSDNDGEIDDLIGAAPVELDGLYGKLTIDAEGNYSYTADVNQPRFTEAMTDSFTYGVQKADGTVVLAELDIVLQPI